MLSVRKGTTKRCCYGVCKSDTRYKSFKTNTYYFINFPKPCLEYRKKVIKSSKKIHIKTCQKCSKCDSWVKKCGRSDRGFKSIDDVTKDTYICSLHFSGESGPSEQNPDPLSYQEFQQIHKSTNKVIKARTSLLEKYQRHAMEEKNLSEERDINNINNISTDLLVEMKRQSTPRKRKEKRNSNKPVLTNKVSKLPIRKKTVTENVRLSVWTQTEVFMDWTKFLTVGHLDRQSMISILGLPHLTKIIKFLKMLQLNETYMKISDQLVLVIWKYRFNLNFESYSYMFSYNENMMSNMSTLYDCFHTGTVNFYKYIQHYEENTIQELRRLISRRIYLDVFEIPVSSYLTFDEMNYSSQYGTTTFKAIVLFVGSFQILYVSDLYAGSTKISHIIKSSQIGNVIRPDDYIIYSKKITQSEVSLINAYIVHNLPEDKKVFFSTIQMKIRKKYKILNDILPVSYWPIANQIFHNCVSLFNMNLRTSYFEFSKGNYNNVIFGPS